MKKLLVLFKTHLDVGFTDYAYTVVDAYQHTYIPHALSLAWETRNEKERFVWMTGSWIIWKFWKQADREERELFEKVLSCGGISWHALAYTTHTEIMSRRLFLHSLSYAKELDAHYGKRSIAGKMTDVPGHTRAMVPILADNGIEFLHIGVNPASAVPSVPPFFRWESEGKSVLVMYEGTYGGLTLIPGTETGVYFAHTSDNLGPQDAEGVRAVYRSLHQQYPHVELVASSLDDVAVEARKAMDVPVIDKEIGDSWIRGAASDPLKMSRYRELLRLADEEPVRMENALDDLLMISEHTWGLDVKLTLGQWAGRKEGERHGDHGHYDKESFNQARMLPSYRRLEASWDEQREYLSHALSCLDGKTRALALSRLSRCVVHPFPMDGWEKLDDGRAIAIKGWTMRFDHDGSLSFLEKGGKTYGDCDHRYGTFLYEVFGEKEYREYYRSYASHDYDWSREDFMKIGEGNVLPVGKRWHPHLDGLYRKGNSLLLSLSLEGEASESFGAPRHVWYRLDVGDSSLSYDLRWFRKDPVRIAEALWFCFDPPGDGLSVRKLGTWIPSHEYVERGGSALQGTDWGSRCPVVEIESLDASVLSPGKPSVLDFGGDCAMSAASCFLLSNNTWGTNFVMWYGEDARFRFVLRFPEGKEE